MSRHLTDDPIDVGHLTRAVMRASDGALVLFSGVVRDHHEGHAVESIFGPMGYTNPAFILLVYAPGIVAVVLVLRVLVVVFRRE